MDWQGHAQDNCPARYLISHVKIGLAMSEEVSVGLLANLLQGHVCNGLPP